MSMSFNSEAFRAEGSPPKPIPDPTSPKPSTSLLEHAGTLTREYRATVHAWLELAALETRLAARKTVHVVALAMAMAVLLVGAYLSLIGTGVLVMISQGLSSTLAMLAATLINLIAAALVFFGLRSKIRSLGWPATSRALKTDPATTQEP